MQWCCRLSEGFYGEDPPDEECFLHRCGTEAVGAVTLLGFAGVHARCMLEDGGRSHNSHAARLMGF
jgi:hypothetical protein